MTKDEMNKQLLQQVNSLTSTVDSLNATINAQTQLIAQLNQTIQELKEQLNKNSKNNSKPPSSDGFKKPAPKSLRKPSGKKAGGQNGHQGTHLAVITAPDKIVKHMPSACEGCPHYFVLLDISDKLSKNIFSNCSKLITLAGKKEKISNTLYLPM